MKINELLKLMNQRVSVREFKDDVISKEDLITLAEAGRTAPTAMNRQLLTFTIVDNAKMVKTLAKAIGKAIKNPNYNLYNTKQLILISTPRSNKLGEVEIGLASENIYLAATALNLGIVWTNQLRDICDDEGVRSVLNTIGIDSNDICYNALVVGKPVEISESKEHTQTIRYVN